MSLCLQVDTQSYAFLCDIVIHSYVHSGITFSICMIVNFDCFVDEVHIFV